MFDRRFAIALSLALLAAGGWALAQQGQQQPEGPAPGKAQGGPPGHFSLATAGGTTVLLDAATGKTWVLHTVPGGAPFWVPLARANSVKDVNTVLAAQEEYRALVDVVAREVERRKAALPAPKTEK